MKPAAALAALAITLGSVTALVRPVSAQGTVYWDINGATPGAGGATPTGTWNAANTNWSSSADGDVDTAAWTAGNTAVFAAGTDATGTYTVTVSGTQDIGGLTFQEGTVTLSGGSLQMVADSIFDVATGRSATISATLSNDVARTLTKSGGGTLTASATVNHTGGTIINAGMLVFSSGATVHSGPVTINSSGTMRLTANKWSTGTNAVTVNAGGLLQVSTATNQSPALSNLILNGGTVSSTTGAKVNNPTIRAAGATTSTISAPVGNSTNGFTYSMYVEPSSTLLISGQVQTGGSDIKLIKYEAGTLILSASNTYTGLTTVSAGILNIRNSNALGTTAVGTTVTTDAALEVQGDITVGAEALTLNGAGISSGGALRNISGDNTYGGAITLGSAARINSDAGTLTLDVASGNAIAGAHHLTFGGAGDITVADAIATSTGGLTKDGAGTLTLSASNSYQGGTTINFGTLRAEHADAFGAGAIVLASSATLDLNNLAIANGITNNGGTISGLAGYAGTQNVLGLTSLTGTVGGTVNVGIGGTLKGTNTTFTGAVAIADQGIHSPGNSPGVQTFESGINYNAGSTLIWELVANTTSGAGTSFDLVNVTGGDLSIADGALLQLEFQNTGLVSSAVDWSDAFWNVAQSWTIIDFSSAGTSSGNFTLVGSGASWLDSTGASLATARNGDASFQVSKVNGDVVLSYVIVVPEPGTLVLAGIGIAVAAWAARRRGSLR